MFVVLDEVYEFKLPVEVSIEFNLPSALEVNVFKELVEVCKVPITVLLLPV
jgi:hypothetical protein